MAKAPRRGTEATAKNGPVVAPEKPKEAEKVAKTTDEPEAPTPTGPQIPFSRWFTSKGYKAHWRAGMEAFTNTSGLRTAEEWDNLFKAY